MKRGLRKQPSFHYSMAAGFEYSKFILMPVIYKSLNLIYTSRTK